MKVIQVEASVSATVNLRGQEYAKFAARYVAEVENGDSSEDCMDRLMERALSKVKKQIEQAKQECP